jgi:hypothetical protein
VPKRPNTPYKTKTQRVGWTRVLSPSSGGHSKMSPTSTLRGLGLGETPLRRWEAVTEMGRSQALIGSIHRDAVATPNYRYGFLMRGHGNEVLHMAYSEGWARDT